MCIYGYMSICTCTQSLDVRIHPVLLSFPHSPCLASPLSWKPSFSESGQNLSFCGNLSSPIMTKLDIILSKAGPRTAKSIMC